MKITSFKNFISLKANQVRQACSKWKQIAATSLLFVVASSAHAAAFSLPSLTSFVCTLLEWMTGELALGVFLIVVIITFVIGFFAKMDWTKILSVVVLYGILQGLANLFSGFLNGSLGCLGF